MLAAGGCGPGFPLVSSPFATFLRKSLCRSKMVCFSVSQTGPAYTGEPHDWPKSCRSKSNLHFSKNFQTVCRGSLLAGREVKQLGYQSCFHMFRRCRSAIFREPKPFRWNHAHATSQVPKLKQNIHRENIQTTHTSLLPRYCVYYASIVCTIYLLSVVCIYFLYYVFIVCIMYLFSVLCIYCLYYVFIVCSMYLFSTLCIYCLYYVFIFCSMYLFSVLYIYCLYYVFIVCSMYPLSVLCIYCLYYVSIVGTMYYLWSLLDAGLLLT
jgi:hypothetical protein